MRSGAPGKVSSLFLRGSESNHTLLLLEGMPLNDPYFGNIYLSEYLSESFSKVEILKGPYSSIYGSEAMGGVVSLFLKKEDRANFSIGFGNYGYGDLNFSYGKDKINFHFSKHIEKGRMENDGWDENQGFFYFDGENLNALVFARKGKVEIPFNGSQLTPLRNQKTEDYLLGLPYEKEFLNGWKIDGFFGFLKSNFYFEDPEDSWGYTWGKTKSQRFFGNFKIFKSFNGFHFAFGFEGKSEKVWDENVFGKNLEGESFGNGAIFFQGKKEFKSFNIQFGLRYDKSSNFGDSLNPKVGLFIPIKNINFYLQAGTGFRAPSNGELYFPYSGNKNLKEEKLKSYEMGFSYKNFNLNFFSKDFKNLIDFEFSTYKFENIGKAEIKGIEASYRNSFLSISLNYLNTKDLIEGKELLRRPEIYGNISLYKNFKDFSFNFLTLFISERWDVDQNFQRIKMDPFIREDFSLSFKFMENLRTKIKIENLFNSSYEEVYGYKALGRRLILNFERAF
ncbi:MAG: TonB-dependent receptor [Thermoanaerobaculia bacterium]